MTAHRRSLALIVPLIVAIAAGASLHAQQDDRFAALVGLARVKRDAGDLPAARRAFDEARKIHGLNAAELAEYFWIVVPVDPAAGLTIGRDVLRGNTASADVRDRMMTAAIALGDEATVVSLAAEGQRVNPTTARWPRRRAESAWRSGQPAEAAAAYAEAVRAPDATNDDRAGLAVADEAAGAFADAIAAWNAGPDGLWTSRPDWAASRLRALSHAAPPTLSAPEVDAWVAAHPDDAPLREILVDLWTRAGRPDLALAALAPLSSGPDAALWTRKQAQLARAAGDRQLAIALLRDLARRGLARAGEKWDLVNLLLDAHDVAGAMAALAPLSAATAGCDTRLFQTIDRLPDPAGTDMLLGALRTRGCAEAPQWLRRGIERAVAAGRHADALDIVNRLPPQVADAADMRSIHGQLLLWTGDAGGAAALLEDVVARTPADAAARVALVDAERALGHATTAWRAAAPLLLQPSSLEPARVMMLANLALEADHPELVAALVSQFPPADRASAAARELTGRAFAALGQPAEAERLLASLPAAGLSPSGALALLDSAIAVDGYARAHELAARFPEQTMPWRDVLGRRVTIETMAGTAVAAAALRTVRDALDPASIGLVDAETALARERPLEALAALDQVKAHEWIDQADDLRATALAGIENFAGADAILARLAEARPDFAAFAIRRADLAWRLSPSAEHRDALVALSGRFPGNDQAAVAAAEALASEDRHDEALAVLGIPARAASASIDVRLAAARSLRELGRTDEALAILPPMSALAGSAAIVRADLTAAVEGPEAAADALRVAAGEPQAVRDVYLAWARLPAGVVDRVAVLRAGSARFPQDADLVAALASALLASGDREAARIAAWQAIGLDAQQASAWFTLVDATAAVRPRADLDDVLARFAAAAADRAPLVIGMAEHITGLARTPADALLVRALAWVDNVDGTANPDVRSARDLARVRILAAETRYNDAIGAVTAIVAAQPHATPALKLRAEVLSWSGAYGEALAAYDDYLAETPHDLDARRQQARVAGWGGRFDDARRLYAALRKAYPDHAALSAEAAAKDAFYAGRWRAAVAAYTRWLALEPENTEARFELAESLRASGEIGKADATLAALEATSGHRLAADARDQARIDRQPSVSAITSAAAENGYGGAALLDLRQQGAGLRASIGPAGGATIALEGSAVQAAADADRRLGYRASAGVALRLSPAVDLEATAAGWDFRTPGNSAPIPDVRTQLTWRAADQWTILAGGGRQPIMDTLATIDSRLAASGLFAGAALDTPRSSFSVRVAGDLLSDANRRYRATLTAGRSVSERLAGLRLVAWAEELSYLRTHDAYFSPAAFLRVDGGAEYRWDITHARFHGDPASALSVGYLYGTDNRHVRYTHPSMRLALALGRNLALDAQADWIRSSVYRATAVTIGLRVAR